MQDIYTIKVKTRPDPGGLYPSERRYSASNVSGLAWVHLALAVLSFLLACLALVNPIGGGDILEWQNIHNNRRSISDDIDYDNIENGSTLFNASRLKLPMAKSNEYGSVLISAPSLLTIAALISGIASILASKQWYIDRNIKWLFAISVLSTVLSLISFCMIAVWIGVMSEGSFHFTNFYKDLPYDDTITPSADSTNIVIENSSLYYVVKVPLGKINSNNYTNDKIIGTLKQSHNATKRVLSINILIAAFLEFIWSCLSVRISWKGMRTNYTEDEDLGRRGGNCLEVITTLKGNNTRHLPRNTKIIPPKPDIVGHYPKNSKIKRLFLAQQDLRANGTVNMGTAKLNGLSPTPRENSAEYRERMYDFINKCPSSFEDIESNHGGNIPSVISETSNTNARTVSPIHEETPIDEKENSVFQDKTNSLGRLSCMSWGDQHDQTIYNQNTINLDTFIAEKRKGIPTDEIRKGREESSETLPNLDLHHNDAKPQDTKKNMMKNDTVDNPQIEKSVNEVSINTTDNLNVIVSNEPDVIIEYSPIHDSSAPVDSKSEKSVMEKLNS